MNAAVNEDSRAADIARMHECVAAMVPGAFMVSKLGREKATVAITLLSISLAIPTLIWG